MADQDNGGVDVSEHEKTLEGLIRVMTWVAAVAILVLIFLAIFNT